MSSLSSQLTAAHGCGSKLNHQGTPGFNPGFHLPGFHFGYPFLTHIAGCLLEPQDAVADDPYQLASRTQHDV